VLQADSRASPPKQDLWTCFLQNLNASQDKYGLKMTFAHNGQGPYGHAHIVFHGFPEGFTKGCSKA